MDSFICGVCSKSCARNEILRVDNPFDSSQQVPYCPHCKGANRLALKCYVDGCGDVATTSWREGSGMRHACLKHNRFSYSQPADQPAEPTQAERSEAINMLIGMGFTVCGKSTLQRKTAKVNLVVAFDGGTANVCHGSAMLDHVYGSAPISDPGLLKNIVALATITQIAGAIETVIKGGIDESNN